MLLLAGQAAGARKSEYALRQVNVGEYPIVQLVARAKEATKPPPVYEDGRRVNVTDVQGLGDSKAIVLAIDRSKSMHGAPLTEAGKAAKQFLNTKRNADRIGVVTFGSTALTQSRLQQSTIDADIVLRNLSTDTVEGTALSDAIVVASTALGSQSLTGRVLVVLTDGHDVRSIASFDDAIRSARRNGVAVYPIALGDADRAPLAHLARVTGGTLYTSPTPRELEGAYRRIGGELNRTWRISYTTAAPPGEEIKVAVGSRRGPSETVTMPGKSQLPKDSILPGWLVRGTGGALLLALLVATLVFLAVRRAQTLPQAARIKRIVRSHTDPRGSVVQRKRRERPTLTVLLTALDERLKGVRRFERVERLVETAAIPVSAPTVVVGAVLVAILLPVIAAGLGVSSTLMFLVLFALGLIGPFMILRSLAARRVRAFEEQLPDVLSTIASSLRVGHGLKASLQRIADEGAPPISTELRRVLSEARLGRPLEESLVAMCERLGSDDLLYVATAVDVQSQVGGSLAGVFATVSDTVRLRQQHRSRVRALTATGRASATVLTAFPFCLVLLMLLINPDYMVPFLKSSIGQALMAYSLASMTIAALLLRRIANVKG